MKLSSALLSVAALLPFAAAKQGRSALHAFQRADKVKEAFNEKLAARAAEATRVEEPLLQKRASPFATNATQSTDHTLLPSYLPTPVLTLLPPQSSLSTAPRSPMSRLTLESRTLACCPSPTTPTRRGSFTFGTLRAGQVLSASPISLLIRTRFFPSTNPNATDEITIW